MIKKMIRKVYHAMQHYYPTFRLLVWLKEKGVTRRINFLISHDNDEYYRTRPTEKMIRAQNYYNSPEIQSRIEAIMNLLSDDMSRQVMGGTALSHV